MLVGRCVIRTAESAVLTSEAMISVVMIHIMVCRIEAKTLF